MSSTATETTHPAPRPGKVLRAKKRTQPAPLFNVTGRVMNAATNFQTGLLQAQIFRRQLLLSGGILA